MKFVMKTAMGFVAAAALLGAAGGWAMQPATPGKPPESPKPAPAVESKPADSKPAEKRPEEKPAEAKAK